MDLEALKTYCGLFYSSHYIPIFILNDTNEVVFSCCPLKDLQPDYEVKKILKKNNPSVYSSHEAGFWGRTEVLSTTYSVVIGPVFSGSISTESIHAFLNRHFLPIQKLQEVSEFLNALPKYSYYSFLNLIVYLNYIFNKKVVDILSHFDKATESFDEKVSSSQTKALVSAQEDYKFHGTYVLEQRMIDFIRMGDIHGLKSFLQETIVKTKLQEGKLAESPLRQAKNIFIGAATMFGKVGAISGGLDVEETYCLIDTYIQECERLSTMEDITALQYNMVVDFTRRVKESQIPNGISKDVYDCMQFIHNHRNESIGLDDVADHIKKSRAYITARFKKETGKTINEYIIDKKLSEAKSLLRHTDKPLIYIAYTLCFSSQSYFQKLFKKKFGETPTEYREKHLKN